MSNLFFKKQDEKLDYINLLISGEVNLIAKMANVSAILKSCFNNWIWVGFYMVDDDKSNQLVLGPFQGQIASFREDYNQGILGKAWSLQKSIVMENLNDFCDELKIPEGSQSQVAIPLLYKSKVVAVFSIYSTNPKDFDKQKTTYLEKIMNLLMN